MTTPQPAKGDPLLCSSDQVGECALCHAKCHRYGPGGNPLCLSCLVDVEAGRTKQPVAR
ncbi:hypothetical protein [Streptomyces sp. NPDC055105]|uniref:hypothetical protein n=1 Tax=Streptomyces sp. NPDC055105 TaxID=3365719 RepID=UPI0037D58175